jgi:hypothetical protein
METQVGWQFLDEGQAAHERLFPLEPAPPTVGDPRWVPVYVRDEPAEGAETVADAVSRVELKDWSEPWLHAGWQRADTGELFQLTAGSVVAGDSNTVKVWRRSSRE